MIQKSRSKKDASGYMRSRGDFLVEMKADIEQSGDVWADPEEVLERRKEFGWLSLMTTRRSSRRRKRKT